MMEDFQVVLMHWFYVILNEAQRSEESLETSFAIHGIRDSSLLSSLRMTWSAR